MKKVLKYILISIPVFFYSCQEKESEFDATGSFEAVETIIPAEVQGVIKMLDVTEGDVLKAGQLLGSIDSTQIYLKKKQVEAQIQSLLSRRPDVKVQLAALQSQLETANTEKKRIENLVENDAATTKQLDDVNAQIKVLQNQIEAQRSTLTITTEGITLDANTLNFQLAQLEDQLKKCRIIAPLSGTVLEKYTEAFEMAQPGKPLFKVADISDMILKVYVTGQQLPAIKIGQSVNVYTDTNNGEYKEASGTISWISSEAEFTPKTIQTKEERANKVYAVKVQVPNDGTYKIGMYGQVTFE